MTLSLRDPRTLDELLNCRLLRLYAPGRLFILDLRGSGTRRLRRIEFWHDSKGLLRGHAAVTVFGMK